MGHACDFLSVTALLSETPKAQVVYFIVLLWRSASGPGPCDLLLMGILLSSGHTSLEFVELGKKATAKVIYTRLYQATFCEIQTISKNFTCIIPLHPYKK